MDSYSSNGITSPAAKLAEQRKNGSALFVVSGIQEQVPGMNSILAILQWSMSTTRSGGPVDDAINFMKCCISMESVQVALEKKDIKIKEIRDMFSTLLKQWIRFTEGLVVMSLHMTGPYEIAETVIYTQRLALTEVEENANRRHAVERSPESLAALNAAKAQYAQYVQDYPTAGEVEMIVTNYMFNVMSSFPVAPRSGIIYPAIVEAFFDAWVSVCTTPAAYYKDKPYNASNAKDPVARASAFMYTAWRSMNMDKLHDTYKESLKVAQVLRKKHKEVAAEPWDRQRARIKAIKDELAENISNGIANSSPDESFIVMELDHEADESIHDQLLKKRDKSFVKEFLKNMNKRKRKRSVAEKIHKDDTFRKTNFLLGERLEGDANRPYTEKALDENEMI